MDWYVMRLPATGGVGLVPESSLDHHRDVGWLRVSEALSRDARFVPNEYAEAPDLDAKPEPPASKPQKEK